MNVSDLDENEFKMNINKKNSEILLSSFHDITVSINNNERSSKKHFSIFGLLLLMAGVLGGSSMAPCFNMYGNISTFTKNLWRCQMNFWMSIPFVLYAYYSERNSINFEFLKSLKGTGYLLLSGVIFTGGWGTFIASAWLTISSHTYTLGSLAGVIIILVKIFSLNPVHNLEKLGTTAVILGSILLMYDGKVEKAGNQEVSIMGDVFAIASSWFYALYFPLNRMIIQNVPGLIIFMYTSFSAFWCFFFINLVFRGIEPSMFFSMDPHYGLFGWLSSEQILISLFLIAPICGLWGNGGQIFSLKYFEPHIVGNALLLEPFVGQLISWLIGLELIPGILTFIGASIVISGIIIVSKGTQTARKDKSLKDIDI